MVKLDVSILRYLSKDDMRVLTAVEMGMKNHDLVPTALIASIARLKRGGAYKCLSNLLKHKLLQHDSKQYDGYRLNYSGYDYLALRAMTARGSLHSVGNQIGVGKEADVFVAMGRRVETPTRLPDALLTASGGKRVGDIDADDDDDDDDGNDVNDVNDEDNDEYGEDDEGDLESYDDANDDDENLIPVAVKFHRLGRTSFRSVKTNRDYHKNRTSVSWLYLSRLGAMKEYAFMQILYHAGFPVPEPIDWNRHVVVMEKLQACPLSQVRELSDPAAVFCRCMEVIVRLAMCGLIHCDFNEFNILVSEKDPTKIYFIDFPQMVSTSHKNAEILFDRDVECLKKYFSRRFGFDCTTFPTFAKDVVKALKDRAVDVDLESFPRLDVAAQASGFSKEKNDDLMKHMSDNLNNKDDENIEDDDENDKDDGEKEDDIEDSTAVDNDTSSNNNNNNNNNNVGTVNAELQRQKAKKEEIRNKVRSQSHKGGGASNIIHSSRNKGKSRDGQKLKNEIKDSTWQ